MRTAPAILVVGVLVLVWQGYRLRHRAASLGSWAITIALFAVCGSVALRILAEPGELLAALNPAIRILLVNLVIVVATLALRLFWLHMAREVVDSHKVRMAIGTAAAVALLLTVLVIGIVVSGSNLNYERTSLQGLPAALFYVSAGTYFSCILIGCSVWMFRQARRAAGHIRVGFALTGIGNALVGAFCVVNAIFVVIVYFGGPHLRVPAMVATAVNSIAAPSIVLGFMLPTLVGRLKAFSYWCWQLRSYVGLRPLWEAAMALHPEFKLKPKPSGPQGGGQVTESETETTSRRLRGVDVDYRLHRRRAECYDALTKVRDHLRGDDTTSPAALALVEVLKQHPDLGHLAEQEQVSTSAAVRRDTDRLVEISRALGRVGSAQRPQSRGSGATR
ncbi:MAB_1171c family putative transporter [Pseudonocardia sp. N23]|uniref:MAB_1171c family putative transporter n=1 Tax=Pseudonocardia sp. N23 TaxID=1987376 RepID=UPI000BFCED36|nr:MAB_1171c family putative transporter [Pseudonocardia sp. N23]